MATRSRSRSPVGAVPPTRFVSVEDLYDYDWLRALEDATVFIAQVPRATLVLGGNQSLDTLNTSSDSSLALRRRRGGGGLVLLRPEDLWVDWWIPHSDPRWSHDVRVSSIQVGTWWARALGDLIDGDVHVHEGSLEGDSELRVVCFAGRGPGEVFVDERKAVGLTQWRVREGVFVSTVLHAGATTDVLEYLRSVPPGLEKVLDHHTLTSLAVVDRDRITSRLVDADDWIVRTHRVS
jgi:lipoate-protein ligase A